ncbi:unnamed protein product [Medioppia subpectinata]|uniref:Small ribosomal subunit protein uS4 N-terminal domain-containing protein n=1 Tax=Medioppia subpectinata TaxID=1979941 RepID=A0A7R9LQ37_9ACAR|nr:unnamed protein product [Medioppia subpectinata]CAG2120184.1 unnamed protein product [Medioppia subpectinata]
MVRKLKHVERKLLRKVDFIDWPTNNVKELAIMKRFGIERHDYTIYNKMCHKIWKLSETVAALPVNDGFRNESSQQLMEKLYSIGLIKTKRLKKCNSVNVKAFCRRRLPVYMIQSGMFSGPLSMAGTAFCRRRLPVYMIQSGMFSGPLSMAVKYVKHGHIRVGPNVVTDPAFLVTRTHEDFISWTDNLRTKIDTYNDNRDDYKD